MKKLLLLALLPMLLSIGCSKDEPTDPRDAYVGNYNYTMVGSISMNYAGGTIATVPLNESGQATVTKSGENELNIDGVIMTLSGNKLLPITVPFNENDAATGFSMTGTVTLQGTVSAGIITINIIYSGTWAGSQGGTSLSGTCSGTVVSTFTKQ